MFFKGVEREENDYFVTEDNVGMLKVAKEANSIVVILPSQVIILIDTLRTQSTYIFK